MENVTTKDSFVQMCEAREDSGTSVMTYKRS